MRLNQLNKKPCFEKENIRDLTEEELLYRNKAEDFIRTITPYPSSKFSGQGIVICAGGIDLFVNAWLCIKLLKKWECKLPIELWYCDNELTEEMLLLLKRENVFCINAAHVKSNFNNKNIAGWPLKAFAILHSNFRQVLLLDADNMPLRDPSILFEHEEFTDKGAIFWPDRKKCKILYRSSIWPICNLPRQRIQAMESGQVLIDKEKCWQAINLTMHYNEQNHFYYNYVYGDKDTFQLAFKRLEKSYYLMSFKLKCINGVFLQHDFNGKTIFQHNCSNKWLLNGINYKIPGLFFDRLCRTFLSDLRTLLVRPQFWNTIDPKTAVRISKSIGGKKYLYRKNDKIERIFLAESGVIIDDQDELWGFWCPINKTMNKIKIWRNKLSLGQFIHFERANGLLNFRNLCLHSELIQAFSY